MCGCVGHNPGASYLPEMRGLLQAREAYGTKIIVVDPRFLKLLLKQIYGCRSSQTVTML